MSPDPSRGPDATAAHVPTPPSTVDATGAYEATPGSGAGGPPADLPDVPGYHVTGEIARGGMGRVLAARDPAFGREVAVKVLLRPDPAAARLFARESYLTGRLTHPGIPPAHQLGTLADGSPFLAMKLVRGRTLAALLKERPSPAHDLPRFVGIFEQVCQAVGFAHAEGVVHRDLKPANVMVGAFGEVQVMDWGLAFEAGPGADAAGAMGTPAYMAPEQARGEPVDARADVFALGGVLCEVLTGRRPFPGKTGAEAMRRAVAGDVADALARLDACGADRELIDLAKRCLSPAREARPADGTAVAAAVAAYRAGVEERLRTAERERAAAEARAAEQRKRRRVQLALAAAVVLMVAGGGAAAVWRVQDLADKKAEALRLENEETTRKTQAEAAAKPLLDLAAGWLAKGDADRAEPFVDAAEKGLASAGVTSFAERVAQYRTALAEQREFDKVDNFRFTPDGSGFPGPEKVVAKWSEAFERLGIVPGVTKPAAAATRITASPIQDSFLAALHAWLVLAPAEPLRAILDESDRDLFRSELRRLATSRDGPGFAALTRRHEWRTQPAWLAVAYIASQVVPLEDRRPLMEQVAQVRPTDFGLLMQLGLANSNDTPADTAAQLRWYQAAVALRPTSSAALNNLGIALEDTGDHAGAEAAYREAIRLDPKFPLAHNNLGNTLSQRGDMSGAEAAYREAIRLDPKLARPHTNLGNALYRSGDLPGAEAAHREAIRLDPSDALPHVNLGLVLNKKGNLLGAEAAYREAIRLDPKDHDTHLSLGKLLGNRGDLAGAEAVYRDAIRLKPKAAAAHLGLGAALKRKDDLPGAEAALRAAIQLDPKSALAQFNLGTVLSAKGDLPGTEAAYRESIRLDPMFAPAHNNLGKLLEDRDDLPGAESAYRAAIRLNPNLVPTHNALGLIYESWLDLDRAEAAYREAVRLNPRYALAHANLGDVYRKQARHAEAVAAYRAALAIQSNLGFARDGLDYCERVLRGEVPTAPPPRPVER